MELTKIPETLGISNFPVALGGCRNTELHFDCCEYNITVFDGESKDSSIHEIDGNLIKLHHGSLSETNVSVLKQFEGMKILVDDQWNLRIFLSQIKEKSKQISNSYSQSCLIDASIYVTNAKEKLKASDPLAPILLKCAVYFLADALFLMNSKRPSPTHMLEIIRGFEKNRINQIFSVLHQCLGMERASTSLLSRMLKSTIGFSDMVEKNGNSRIIQQKYDYLVRNALLSDCYFYLGYINRNNVIKIKEVIDRNREFFHILKVALDTESDPMVIERQATDLLKIINNLLTNGKSS